jgi:hypothetical protein
MRVPKTPRRLTELELGDILSEEELDMIPTEVRMAISESIKSSEAYGDGSSTTTGQSYKPIDYDDFPIGMYMINKTGKNPSAYFRISDEFQVKQEEALVLVDKLGFVEIFNKSLFMNSGHFENKIYEKVFDDGIVLLMIDSIAKKWGASVSKSYRADRGINISLSSNASPKDFDKITSQ